MQTKTLKVKPRRRPLNFPLNIQTHTHTLLCLCVYMLSVGASADVSPSFLSLIAFKPRQILLAEQKKKKKKRSSTSSMGKNIPAQLKPEQQDSILTYSVALWLEHKGFSKVLKRFLSSAQIEDEDWKAKALNLNEVFSKYQEISKDVSEGLIPQKKQEEPALGTSEKNGVVKSMAHEDIENKKKKKTNKGEVALTENGRTSEDMEVDGEVKKPYVNGKEDKVLKEFNNEKVFEFTANLSDKPQKEKKKKKSKSTLEDKKKNKSKSTLESLDVNENQKDVAANVTEEMHKTDSEVVVESKDKKKKKKSKGNLLDANKDRDLVKNTVAADKDATTSLELPPSGTECNGKSKKRPAEAAENEADESKKTSKKRKIMALDENETKSGVEVATEESIPKKAKGLEEGKDNSKSGRKQNGNIAEPRTVKAFQRVKVEEVKFADERLQDNSYWAKDGAEIGYGAKAQEVLGQVRGRDFRHEKTKKKRGSYRGGIIDLQSHSIKFDNSDDE